MWKIHEFLYELSAENKRVILPITTEVWAEYRSLCEHKLNTWVNGSTEQHSHCITGPRSQFSLHHRIGVCIENTFLNRSARSPFSQARTRSRINVFRPTFRTKVMVMRRRGYGRRTFIHAPNTHTRTDRQQSGAPNRTEPTELSSELCAAAVAMSSTIIILCTTGEYSKVSGLTPRYV